MSVYLAVNIMNSLHHMLVYIVNTPLLAPITEAHNFHYSIWYAQPTPDLHDIAIILGYMLPNF